MTSDDVLIEFTQSASYYERNQFHSGGFHVKDNINEVKNTLIDMKI